MLSMESCRALNKRLDQLVRKSDNISRYKPKGLDGLKKLNSRDMRRLNTLNRQYQALKRKAKKNHCSLTY